MILIRADAGELIGTGHIMRCLAIAREIIRFGEKVLFVTANHKSDRLITPKGFESICLESDYTKMEEEGISEIIRRFSPRLVIVVLCHPSLFEEYLIYSQNSLH